MRSLKTDAKQLLLIIHHTLPTVLWIWSLWMSKLYIDLLDLFMAALIPCVCFVDCVHFCKCLYYYQLPWPQFIHQNAFWLLRETKYFFCVQIMLMTWLIMAVMFQKESPASWSRGANQRPVLRSRDQCWPIRGQRSHDLERPEAEETLIMRHEDRSWGGQAQSHAGCVIVSWWCSEFLTPVPLSGCGVL